MARAEVKAKVQGAATPQAPQAKDEPDGTSVVLLDPVSSRSARFEEECENGEKEDNQEEEEDNGSGGHEPEVCARERMERAVALVGCVRQRRPFIPGALETAAKRNAHYASRLLSPLASALLMVYMAAYFFEVPPWCWDRESGCGDDEIFMRSPLSSQIPEREGRLVSLLCLGVFLATDASVSFALGTSGPWAHLGRVASSLALLDTVAALLNGNGLPPRTIYWSPLLRPLVLLAHWNSAQAFFRDALPAAMNPRVLDFFMMEAALMGLWVWCGLLLFGHTPEGDAYFPDLDKAARSLFILFSTANFPDVMMLAYVNCRWTVFYFALFLVLSLYMFFNILLAALFSAYKANVKKTIEDDQRRTAKALSIVFGILVGPLKREDEGHARVSKATWVFFWHTYCKNDSGGWNADRAEKLYHHLASHSGGISEESWQRVGSLFAKPEVRVQMFQPPAPSPAIGALVHMHFAVDVSVVVSLIASVFQTIEFLQTGQHDFLSDWRTQSVQLLCCGLYFGEMAVRMAALGQGRFWRSYRYGVDAVMAVSCLSLEVVLQAGRACGFLVVQPGSGGERVRRVLALLRVARIERLLWRFERLREALYTLFLLLGTFRKVASALFLVFVFYGTVGVQVFGGLIRTDSETLKETDFAAAGGTGYYANSFNDFASGVVVLFELMVINNWFVIAGGLAAVAPLSPKVAWTYCISFYICIHAVILNVLVTSVVESYHRLMPDEEEGSEATEAVEAQPGPSVLVPELEVDAPLPRRSSDSKNRIYSALLRSESSLLCGDENPPTLGSQMEVLLDLLTASREIVDVPMQDHSLRTSRSRISPALYRASTGMELP